ncbi:MAG: hypothetical protein WDN09_02140 [bacterium]
MVADPINSDPINSVGNITNNVLYASLSDNLNTPTGQISSAGTG